MRLVSLFVVAMACLAGISGCAKVLSAQDLVGSWTGKLSMTDADMLAQLKKMGKTEKDLPAAKQEMEATTIPLELKKDMTYTIGSGGGTTDGTWKYAEGKLTLVMTKVNGMSVDDIIKKTPQAKDQLKPMDMTVDKEGKTVSYVLPPPAANLTISFTKPAATK